jgi:uncharacterized membrane protein YeaQ/YmgE (transglycosylase-associated protein family)
MLRYLFVDESSCLALSQRTKLFLIMEAILPLVIQALAGGGGGFLGNLLKSNNLGMIGNLLAGAVGGVGTSQGLAAAGVGDSTNMIMSIVTSLVGGGLGSVIGGLFKKA